MAEENKHFVAVVIGNKNLDGEGVEDQAISKLKFDDFYVDSSTRAMVSMLPGNLTQLGLYYNNVTTPSLNSGMFMFQIKENDKSLPFVFDCGEASKESPANIVWVELSKQAIADENAAGSKETGGWRIHFVHLLARCYLMNDPFRSDVPGAGCVAHLQFGASAVGEDLAAVRGKNARFKLCTNGVFGTTETSWTVDEAAGFKKQWELGLKGNPVT